MFELERKIDELLDYPNRWCVNQYEAISKDTPHVLWVGNGFLAFALYRPMEVRFSIWWKWHLWRKLRRVISEMEDEV